MNWHQSYMTICLHNYQVEDKTNRVMTSKKEILGIVFFSSLGLAICLKKNKIAYRLQKMSIKRKDTSKVQLCSFLKTLTETMMDMF